MGYQLTELQKSQEKTQEFINLLLQNVEQLLDVNIQNGVQNFVAAMLPDQSIYLSISCADSDDEIDRCLDGVKGAIGKVCEMTSDENILEIKNLSGKDKLDAYSALMNQLKQIFVSSMNQSDPIEVNIENARGKLQHHYNLMFPTLDRTIEFCHVLGEAENLQGRLIKCDRQYYLQVNFEQETEDTQIINFVALVEEFEGKLNSSRNFSEYLNEHGEMLVKADAVNKLMMVQHGKYREK